MRITNFVVLLALAGQGFGVGQTPAPAKSAREEAPIDLTGYWTSIVTQDWLYRMRTPPKAAQRTRKTDRRCMGSI